MAFEDSGPVADDMCIFCGSPHRSQSPEHILLSSFGGRIQSKTIICCKCNNEFGGSIDKELAREFEPIRHFLGVKRRGNQDPPKMKFDTRKHGKIAISGSGKVKVNKPFIVEKFDDGTIDFQIYADTIEEAKKQLPDAAKSVGVNPVSLLELFNLKNKGVSAERIGKVSVNIATGSNGAFRSLAKSFLELLAYDSGNSTICHNFSEAKEFVTDGSASFMDKSAWTNDINDTVFSTFGETYSRALNVIHVQSDHNGHTIGYGVLFGITAFTVIIAEQSDWKDKSITLVSNPLDNTKHELVKNHFLIDHRWLSERNFSKDLYLDNHKQISKLCSKIQLDRLCTQFMDEVFSSMGKGKNDPFSKDDLRDFSSRFSRKIATHMSGISYILPTKK